jgi:hypothetical protein
MRRRRRGTVHGDPHQEGSPLPHRTIRATDERNERDDPTEPAAPAASARPTPDHDGPTPRLETEEELLVVLRGIGAVMFLTSQRVIVARDGVERRPRTGIQSFALGEIRHLRLELGSAPSGRIAVWTAAGQEAVSMFFDSKSLDRAHELIDVARPLVARERRRGQGAGPVRSPSGPAGSSGTPDPT